MAYIAHVLPFSCNSKEIRTLVLRGSTQNFHQKWTLNGWNGDIIQTARDAVLKYYKVRVYTTLLIRASFIQVQWNFILSAMQIVRMWNDTWSRMTLNKTLYFRLDSPMLISYYMVYLVTELLSTRHFSVPINSTIMVGLI